MKGKKLLLSLLGGALCSFCANALNFTIGAYNYATNDDTDSSCTITSISGYIYGDVEIPATVDAFDDEWNPKTYTVTAIGAEAIQYCEDVTSFTFPATIKTIGDYAFNGCIGISELVLPDALTKLGDFAFSGCSGLKSVTFGMGISEIGDYAFEGIPLESIECHATIPPVIGEDTFSWEIWGSVIVKVPAASVDAYKSAQNWSYLQNYEALASDEVTEIEIDNVIYGDFSTAEPYTCNVIGSTEAVGGNVTIPATVEANGKVYSVKGINANAFKTSYIGTLVLSEGIETIGANAFDGCADMRTASLPSTLKTIGQGAFIGCMTLAEINIPGSVTTIEPYTFKYCSKLNNITIGEGVATIGYNAFEKCKSLSSIALPESLTAIGKEAFMECKALGSIVIPDNVVSIGGSAFYSCESLGSIALPATLKAIEPGTFAYSGLSQINLSASLESIGDEAFTYCENLSSLVIPDGVISIGKDAFSECFAMESLTIGNGVKVVSENAFYECSALTEITWGTSVEEIGVNAFAWCQSLTSVELPNSVKTIDRYAFNSCFSLGSVSLGSGIASINESAFYGCEAITEVDSKATVPPVLAVDAFENNVYRNAELIVPEASESAYKEAQGWSKFSQITTGVAGVKASAATFNIAGGNIIFTADNAKATIVDAMGRICFDGAVFAGLRVNLAGNKFYIVTVAGKSTKIIL